MTDLLRILPAFPAGPFAALLPAIERQAITTTDLLALHPNDIARQTRLPLLDLKRFIAAVQDSLLKQLAPEELPLGLDTNVDTAVDTKEEAEEDQEEQQQQHEDADADGAKDEPRPTPESSASPVRGHYISTLDDDLDAALGGGLPLGCITELAGESGAGKTQFLLTLCLAVQLPPPRGLAKKAIYISTESKLSTQRLSQMLAANPALRALPLGHPRPSLDNIMSAETPDLESQDHIVEYQLPVQLERHDVGLVVLDSVAANYRPEFERNTAARGSNLAARSTRLVQLGALLRDMARRHDIAVIVANQVSDRFPSGLLFPMGTQPGVASSPGVPSQESPLASRSMAPPSAFPSATPSFFDPADEAPSLPALQLDHQQRWFTGWGDDPYASHALKTPTLGLVWSTQIACRIALLKRPVYGLARRPTDRQLSSAEEASLRDQQMVTGVQSLQAWRRWMKVVFAPHVTSSGPGTDDAAEFEVTMGGLRGVKPTKKRGAPT